MDELLNKKADIINSKCRLNNILDALIYEIEIEIQKEEEKCSTINKK